MQYNVWNPSLNSWNTKFLSSCNNTKAALNWVFFQFGEKHGLVLHWELKPLIKLAKCRSMINFTGARSTSSLERKASVWGKQVKSCFSTALISIGNHPPCHPGSECWWPCLALQTLHSVCWIYLPHGIIFKVSSNKVACGDPCYDRKVCTWDCNSYSLLSYFPSKERGHFCVYLHSHALSDWLMKLITLTFLTKVSCKTGSIFLDASAFLCMTQWVDCTSRF